MLVSGIHAIISDYEESIYRQENFTEWKKLLDYLNTAYKLYSTRDYEGKLRASGMYYLCARQFVWSHFFPTKGDFDLVSGLRMSLGTSLHSIIQNEVLGPAGVLLGEWAANDPIYHYEGKQRHRSHVYVEPIFRCAETGIQGHADGIIDMTEMKNLLKWEFNWDGRMLFELKTAGESVMSKLLTSEDIPPYYKMQAEIYQELSGINATLFWFLNRDTMKSKFFVYRTTREFWKAAKEKAHLIVEHIAEKRLPLIRCNSHKTCQYCQPDMSKEFKSRLANENAV